MATVRLPYIAKKSYSKLDPKHSYISCKVDPAKTQEHRNDSQEGRSNERRDGCRSSSTHNRSTAVHAKSTHNKDETHDYAKVGQGASNGLARTQCTRSLPRQPQRRDCTRSFICGEEFEPLTESSKHQNSYAFLICQAEKPTHPITSSGHFVSITFIYSKIFRIIMVKDSPLYNKVFIYSFLI